MSYFEKNKINIGTVKNVLYINFSINLYKRKKNPHIHKFIMCTESVFFFIIRTLNVKFCVVICSLSKDLYILKKSRKGVITAWLVRCTFMYVLKVPDGPAQYLFFEQQCISKYIEKKFLSEVWPYQFILDRNTWNKIQRHFLLWVLWKTSMDKYCFAFTSFSIYCGRFHNGKSLKSLTST